jgi:hypothetical protein
VNSVDLALVVGHAGGEWAGDVQRGGHVVGRRGAVQRARRGGGARGPARVLDRGGAVVRV